MPLAILSALPEQLAGLTIILTRLDYIDFRFHVSVGLKKVQPPIQVVIEEKQSKTQRLATDRANSRQDRFVGKQAAALLADIERRHLVGKIADSDNDITVIAMRRRIHAHCACCVTRIIKCKTQIGSCFPESMSRKVFKSEVAHRVIGDHKIQPAVMVQVDRYNRQPLAHRFAGGRVEHPHPL